MIRGKFGLNEIPTRRAKSHIILVLPALPQLLLFSLKVNMQLTTNLRIRRQFVHHNPQARALANSHPRQCPFPDCKRAFTNNSGLTQHLHLQHPDYQDEPSSDDIDMASPVAEHLEGSSSGSESPDTSKPRRATVEDVEDEDDFRSSSSDKSEGTTRKYYHAELNGTSQ